MLDVKTLKETREIVENICQNNIEMEIIQLSDALGRILAEDIYSNKNIPGFTRSTVDGYCVKAEDVFGCTNSSVTLLKKIGNIKMGEFPTFCIESGQCAYIPTGGHIPEGADSVVMIEQIEDYGDEIGVLKAVAPGTNMIFKGEDVKCGNLLFRKGTKVNSRNCGLLAACGICKIKVYKKIKVIVVSTGNELVEPGRELLDGQIYDVNGSMFEALLKECGCDVEFFGIIQDDRVDFEYILRSIIDRCDMVLLSGGTSVGIKDFTAEILQKMGTVLVHGIAVKPGKPTIIADVARKIVFGLPGNPLAAFFIFHLVVKRAIDTMYRHCENYKIEKKILFSSISSNHGREEYIPVRIKENAAYPILGGSGLISLLKDAEGYIKIARDTEGISKGTLVEVIYF